MTEQRIHETGQSPGVEAVRQWKNQGNWEEIAKQLPEIQRPVQVAQADLASEVGFALTQLGRLEEARALYTELYEAAPSHRIASGLAYIHYLALLQHKIKKPRLNDPESWRRGFERWIAEALRLEPKSLKDKYRLAVYHASILAQKDAVALRLFREVIGLFEALPEEVRNEQHRYFKTYVMALYGAARSAYRLKRYEDARRYIYRCIRVDKNRNHQEPLFKFFLAGKVLFALGEHADAERALRIALEHARHREHDFVYALLAEIALATNRPADAVNWLESNVRPHHRKPYIWRLLGDAELARGERRRALKLYKSSLLKDHVGRHLTLFKMGQIYESIREFGEARRCYEQAADFRRRRYVTEYPEALEALAKLCEQQGDIEGARNAYKRMALLPTFADRAQAELARLAG
ncbi:MAG: tetratricopeptide repeat protein [Candidatus Binatia bacterium]|nr:tetratricopeptide repeat protein [Candidatus Binatia bacterium]